MELILFIVIAFIVVKAIEYIWDYFVASGIAPVLKESPQWVDHFWSDEYYLWVLLAIFAIYVINTILQENKAYKKYPTSSEYAEKYLKEKKGNGFQCRKCGSRSIRNWGRAGANDSERLFICNHCGTTLYRN